MIKINKPVAASTIGICVHEWQRITEITQYCGLCETYFNSSTNQYYASCTAMEFLIYVFVPDFIVNLFTFLKTKFWAGKNE